MIYKTILTSKGTTTIPAAIRRQLGIKPGMHVSFSLNKQTGEYVVGRIQTMAELRALNLKALKDAGTSHKEYSRDAGFQAHIEQTFGKNK